MCPTGHYLSAVKDGLCPTCHYLDVVKDGLCPCSPLHGCGKDVFNYLPIFMKYVMTKFMLAISSVAFFFPIPLNSDDSHNLYFLLPIIIDSLQHYSCHY